MQIDNKNPRAHYTLGLAYKESGNLKDAIPSLKKATELKGDHSDFYHLAFKELADCYLKNKQYDKAVETLRGALGNYPEAADIRFLKAQALEKAGNKKEAIEDYRLILNYIPDHGGAIKALKRLGVTPTPLREY